MAGNKSPSRKKKVGSVTDVHRVAANARNMRRKIVTKKNERKDRLNDLPIGHPMNAYKLDQVFGIVDRVLEQQEKDGSLFFVEDMAVAYEQRAKHYFPIVTSFLDMLHAVESVSKAHALGTPPPGLLALTLKLGRSELLNEQDVADAKETVKWMREKIGRITPNQWLEALTAAQENEARREAQSKQAA